MMKTVIWSNWVFGNQKIVSDSYRYNKPEASVHVSSYLWLFRFVTHWYSSFTRDLKSYLREYWKHKTYEHMVHDDCLLFVIIYKTSNLHHFPSNIYVNCFILYKNHIRSTTKNKSELSSFRILRLKTGIFHIKNRSFGFHWKDSLGA